MEELISVIVPVHNGQDYLEKCIESIAAQSYANLEILVVNDGSTDGTAAVCDRLCAGHHNIQIITLPDLGVSAARNRAVGQAKGDYITFVDADDRLRPDMLERLYDSLRRTESDMAGCRFVMWSSEQEWQRIAGETPEKGAGNAEQVFDSYHYLTDNILENNCRCWSKLYRRSLVENTAFREGLTIGEDMLFLVDILQGVRRAVELTYEGYGYYQNPKGVIKRKFSPAYMDQITCWELAGEKIRKIDGKLNAQTEAKVMTAIMLTVGKIAALGAGERRQASEYLAICREKLARYVKNNGSYQWLPEGYPIKVKMFYRLPKLYVWSYHLLQTIKGIGK